MDNQYCQGVATVAKSEQRALKLLSIGLDQETVKGSPKGVVATPNDKDLRAFVVCGRTPHDSRGRKWGCLELNRDVDTPQGTGAIPHVSYRAGLITKPGD